MAYGALTWFALYIAGIFAIFGHDEDEDAQGGTGDPVTPSADTSERAMQRGKASSSPLTGKHGKSKSPSPKHGKKSKSPSPKQDLLQSASSSSV
jgi:hypothetical protein